MARKGPGVRLRETVARLFCRRRHRAGCAGPGNLRHFRKPL